MRKLLTTTLVGLSYLLSAQGPNDVCVNDEFFYVNLYSAISGVTDGDHIYFHEQAYDWENGLLGSSDISTIEESCLFDGKGTDETSITFVDESVSTSISNSVTVTIKEMTLAGNVEFTVRSGDVMIFEDVIFDLDNEDIFKWGTLGDVQFINCIFNGSGHANQLATFNGNVSFSGCVINDLTIYQYNHGFEAINTVFNNCWVSSGTDGGSTTSGPYNANLIQNVTVNGVKSSGSFSSVFHLDNGAEHMTIDGFYVHECPANISVRLYADTLLVSNVLIDSAKIVDMRADDTKSMGNSHDSISITNLRIGELTGGSFNVNTNDSSSVFLENCHIGKATSYFVAFNFGLAKESSGQVWDCTVGETEGNAFYSLSRFSDVEFFDCGISGESPLATAFTVASGSLNRCWGIEGARGYYATGGDEVLISNCVFANNSGHGVYYDNLSGESLSLVNNTIVNNGDNGVYLGQAYSNSVNYLLMNNIIAGNGTDIYSESKVTQYGNLQLRNNLFGSTLLLQYTCDNCLEDTVPDFEYSDGVVNDSVWDFSLSPTSAAVDAGSEDTLMVDVDFILEDRVLGSSVDIGAYESPYLITSTKSAAVKSMNLVVYPNPTTESLFVGGLSNGNFTIVNPRGQIEISGSATESTIQVESLDAGLYILETEQGRAQFIKR